MHDPFTYDPLALGTKGLIFIGGKLLVYRRDTHTSLFPRYLDFPGGGAEPGETPFETFRRELAEEFRLTIEPGDITYWTRYPAVRDGSKFGYMLAAHFSAAAAGRIVFGDEGTEWMLMDIAEFMSRGDSWPVLKERAADYLAQNKA